MEKNILRLVYKHYSKNQEYLFHGILGQIFHNQQSYPGFTRSMQK